MRADPEIKAKVVALTAVHESGHAVARWCLDRSGFLGHAFPRLRHVEISRTGEPVGGFAGVCVGSPCIMPGMRFVFGDEYTPARRRWFAAQVRRSATADCAHIMAGPISEALHSDDEGPIEDASDWLRRQEDEASLSDDEVGTDFWNVDQRIPLLGRRWRLHLDRAFWLADQIVRGHQPHIEALASALIARGMIRGAEVEQLFDRIAAQRPRAG
jgi:hypothetical protein